MASVQRMKKSSSAPPLKAIPDPSPPQNDVISPVPRLCRSQSVNTDQTTMAAIDSVNRRFRTDLLDSEPCAPTPLNWRLSKYSHFLLDRAVLANYNQMICHKIKSITPLKLYIFRRLLQAVSITLVSLFILILFAMHKHSESIEIPSKMEEIPKFGENLGNLLFDELMLSVLNEKSVNKIELNKPSVIKDAVESCCNTTVFVELLTLDLLPSSTTTETSTTSVISVTTYTSTTSNGGVVSTENGDIPSSTTAGLTTSTSVEMTAYGAGITKAATHLRTTSVASWSTKTRRKRAKSTP